MRGRENSLEQRDCPLKLVCCGKRAKQRAQKTLTIQEQMEEKDAVREPHGAPSSWEPGVSGSTIKTKAERLGEKNAVKRTRCHRDK